MMFRTVFLHYLHGLKCEAEIVIARKVPSRFIHKHHGQDDEFYADVLSHLIKNRLQGSHRLVLDIAERGSSTRAKVLEEARCKAVGRAGKQWGLKHSDVNSSSMSKRRCASRYLRCRTTLAGPCSVSLKRARPAFTTTFGIKSSGWLIFMARKNTPVIATLMTSTTR